MSIWILLARALYTGIVAAGVWAGVDEYFNLSDSASVAVAAGVTILGADVVESFIRAHLEKMKDNDN